VSPKIDHRRLGRLRQGQGELANHIIDEFTAGRLSRRDFIRRASVVGISVPLLGGILEACSSSSSPSSSSSAPATGTGTPGAVIKAGIITPGAAINPLTVSDQGGLDMLGQTGEYLTLATQQLTLQPVLATSWSANSTADVWTFKIRQGVKFSNGSPLTADDVVYTYKLQAPKNSALGGVLTPAGVVKVDDYTVAFHLEGPNGNFPYVTSSENYNMIIIPNNYDPAKWQGPVRDELVHAQGGRHLHPQRVVLGHQGAALADAVHVLRHPAAVDPRADRRDHRRPRAVLGDRRRGAAVRRL
jgi:peptide/nickel transport system substrate-binding protein